MSESADIETLRFQLQELRVEHRNLEAALHQMQETPPCDELTLRRLKKRKLQIKDRITQIEGILEPDISA